MTIPITTCTLLHNPNHAQTRNHDHNHKRNQFIELTKYLINQ